MHSRVKSRDLYRIEGGSKVANQLGSQILNDVILFNSLWLIFNAWLHISVKYLKNEENIASVDQNLTKK